MSDISTTIGQRLRTLRLQRGLSQQELANGAGVSLDLVSKLERDVRESLSWASMVKLARALDVDPGHIAGKGPQLDPVPGAAVLTVRDAVISPDLLPGLHPDHEREPAEPDDLWRLVQRAYGAYFAGEFGVLAAELPSLIAECRLLHDVDAVAAAAPLAHAWQLAACVLVHTGRDDAAAIAAERAILVGKNGEDPWRLATMYGTYSWVMLHQGRLDEAERLAADTADSIEPSMSKASPQQITAWGGLILHAAVACGARGDGERAQDYLRTAAAGAARIDQDRHDYWVSFGPSHVAVQQTHILTALQKPDAALKASARVDREALFDVQYGRHLLNVGRSMLERRRTDDAVDVTTRARDISPEWFRHQGFARSLVDDLAERKTRLTAPLRSLIQTIDHR
jgi:transcriptional regulator with XRE-family HTH domain